MVLINKNRQQIRVAESLSFSNRLLKEEIKQINSFKNADKQKIKHYNNGQILTFLIDVYVRLSFRISPPQICVKFQYASYISYTLQSEKVKL